MSDAFQTPLAWFKANLQLMARMLKLVQEQGRQTVDFSSRLMDETIKESETTLEHATTLVGMSGGTIVLLNVIEEMKLVPVPVMLVRKKQEFSQNPAVKQGA